MGCSIESSRDWEKQDGIVVLISICAEVVATVLMCKGERTGQMLDLEEKRDTQGGRVAIGSETQAGAE